jgi:cyclophilin family peptidyl-prolyl cis-trans isomerase
MKQFFSLIFCCAMMAAVTTNAQVKKAPVKKATTTTTTTTTTSKKTATVRKVAAKPTKMPVDSSIKVKIWTDSGTMIVKLYDSTPLHRDNFVKLVNQGFYDSLLFHRVISTFMIQGGDPLSKNAPAGQMLGNGGGDMQRIPAEFRPTYFHKRGALAAARDGNPEKASSACQFYIVQGKLYKDNELDMMEAQMGRKFTPAERAAYKTVGGTPFLDQNYTVFGEVISGFDVIDKIANAPKAPGDRPLTDIHMKMEVIK